MAFIESWNVGGGASVAAQLVHTYLYACFLEWKARVYSKIPTLKSNRADITLSISSGSSTPGRARHFAMINYGHGIAKGRRGKVQGTLHFGYGSRARGWYRLNRNKMFNCTPSFLDVIFSSFLSSLSLPVSSSRYVVSSWREKKVYLSIFSCLLGRQHRDGESRRLFWKGLNRAGFSRNYSRWN